MQIIILMQNTLQRDWIGNFWCPFFFFFFQKSIFLANIRCYPATECETEHSFILSGPSHLLKDETKEIIHIERTITQIKKFQALNHIFLSFHGSLKVTPK